MHTKCIPSIFNKLDWIMKLQTLQAVIAMHCSDAMRVQHHEQFLHD